MSQESVLVSHLPDASENINLCQIAYDYETNVSHISYSLKIWCNLIYLGMHSFA